MSSTAMTSALGYHYQLLTTADGLASSTVKCILIDSKGFLWIGTDDGLNRYDGYGVELFGKDKWAGYDPRAIEQLNEDAQGVVWIGCQNTYILFDTNRQRPIARAADYLGSLGIDIGTDHYKVKTDDNGALWIIQNGRLSRHDFSKKTTETWRVPQINTGDINPAHCTATKDQFLISCGQKIWQFTRSNGMMRPLALPPSMDHPDNILGAYIDHSNTIWVYSLINDHLCRYVVGGKIVREMVDLDSQGISGNNAIRSLMDDDNGSIWIATDHGGIYIYNKQTGKMQNIRSHTGRANTLSSNNVTSLTQDSHGTVWIGHLKTGISYAATDSSPFTNRGHQYGDISVMHYDRKGNLWIGTDGDGLYVEHKDGTYEKTSLPNITISAIQEDNDGSMWIGTYSDGLYHVSHPHHFERFATDSGKLTTDQVWRLIDDGQGNLWCASPLHPLVVFNKQTGKSHIMNDDHDAKIQATALCRGKDGHIFITSTYGILDCNPHTRKCIRLISNRRGTQQMSDKMALIECYDSSRDILLLGHTRGLTIFDMKNDSLYFINDSISGQTPCPKSIVQDNLGRFWISTSRGITILTIARRRGGNIEWQMNNLAHRDRQHATFFNFNSFAKSTDGHIAFGGTDGYSLISPSEISTAVSRHTVPFITSVSVGNRQVYDHSTDTRQAHSNNKTAIYNDIRFSHDDTYVVIKYFTGDLHAHDNIVYAYKLEGRMDKWTYTDDNRITLVGLSPGNYRLILKVCGEGDEACVLNIHVSPPVYLSAWAFLLYFIVFCGIVYIIWRHLHQKQMNRLEKQKDDLERQKLVQITEMKLRFYTNISHDLRTPLTLIISPVETIVRKLENGEVPGSLLPQLKNVHKNAQLLFDQIGALLDFRRLDVGAETLQLSACDIVAQINSIFLSFSDYAEERHVSFIYECQEESFIMQYDKEKINKVLYNLLSNAFKFTNDGDTIKIALSVSGDIAKIEVSDTGKGIPDTEKSKIFQRFYQSDTDTISQTGSGIGLHIVNEYVQMHGGSISVSDNTPRGSIFTITLKACNPGKGSQPASHPSVLIADDNSDIVDFIADNLNDKFEIYKAYDGQMALDIIYRNNISVIISDVMMPGIDGYELCRRVKSNIHTSHIPIILLTARSTDQNRLEGLQLGADDYITKPFNMDILMLRVQKLMEWVSRSHRDFKKKIDISPSEITITSLDEQLIKRAIEIVEKNMGKSDFTVESFGKELGMSRSFLYKKLTAITGLGPAEFIRIMRLKRGKALLERSQMQISEVAYTVGFNSLKSFTMNFKSEYGMTPSEYIKSLENPVQNQDFPFQKHHFPED